MKKASSTKFMFLALVLWVAHGNCQKDDCYKNQTYRCAFPLHDFCGWTRHSEETTPLVSQGNTGQSPSSGSSSSSQTSSSLSKGIEQKGGSSRDGGGKLTVSSEEDTSLGTSSEVEEDSKQGSMTPSTVPVVFVSPLFCGTLLCLTVDIDQVVSKISFRLSVDMDGKRMVLYSQQPSDTFSRPIVMPIQSRFQIHFETQDAIPPLPEAFMKITVTDNLPGSSCQTTPAGSPSQVPSTRTTPGDRQSMTSATTTTTTQLQGAGTGSVLSMIPSTGRSTEDSTVPTSPNDGIQSDAKNTTKSAESSDTTAAVIAAVVTVVTLVLGLLLVMVILSRTRQQSPCRSCVKKGNNGKRRVQVKAASNAAYSLDPQGVDDSCDVEKSLNPTDALNHGDRLSQSEEHVYSVIPDTANLKDTIPERGVWNSSNHTHSKSLPDTSAVLSVSDDYNTLDFHNRPGRHGDLGSTCDARGDYHHLTSPGRETGTGNEETTLVYHCLEEDEARTTEDSHATGRPQLAEMSSVDHMPDDVYDKGQNEPIPDLTSESSQRQVQHDGDDPSHQHEQQQQQQQQQAENGDAVYHTLEEDSAQDTKDPAVCIYEIPDTESNNTAEFQETEAKILGSSSERNDTESLAEYHSLDLEGKPRDAEKRGDAGAACVYSRLNDQGADTYDQLQRGTKNAAAHNDYAHLV